MNGNEIIRKWIAAFGKNVCRDFIRNNVTAESNFLWHIFSFEKVPCLKGDNARNIFDKTEYTKAIKFSGGFSGTIEDVGVTNKISAEQVDNDRASDVYIVAEDFSWTYVKTHETGICGPYFCRSVMPCGIIVFGLNGSGKSTFGKALARELNYKHMDIEDYYFIKSEIPYSVTRTHDEVISLMIADIMAHETFIISAVDGNLCSEVVSMYEFAVYIDVPHDIRMERIRHRSFERFGNRVLKGGDMYDRENKFYKLVSQRTPEKIERWAETLTCPVMRIDGTKPIEENIKTVLYEYKKKKP